MLLIRQTMLMAMLLGTASLAAMEIVDEPQTSGVLTIKEGDRNVLSYRYGDQLQDGFDEKYTRSSYIHPVWSADGKTILTDDFPEDHPHHRGFYWAWPRVETRGVQTENWHPADTPLRQHFHRWISRTADSTSASVAVENKWVLDNKEEVARERVTITAHAAEGASRAIDIKIQLEAVGGPLQLAGTPQGNKGYGGFCYRASPLFKGAQITTSQGEHEKDIVGEQAAWAALSTASHKVTIYPSPDHPAYPPKWMVRNSYAGFANVSYPGLDPVTLNTGERLSLEYRLLIQDGQTSSE